MDEKNYLELAEELEKDKKIEELLLIQEKLQETVNNLMKEAGKPPIYIIRKIKQAS